MNNKKLTRTRIIEWIVILIMGILSGLITYVTFYQARIFSPQYAILTIPFFFISIVLTIGGLIGLIYIIITKKTPYSITMLCLIFETIGWVFVIGSVVWFISEKSWSNLFPILIAIVFIIEGIRLPKNSFKDKYEKDAISHKKQLYGYKGITAMQWWFGYVWILVGVAILIYATPIVIRIIGIVFIIFGLYCYIKKATFYIKLKKRKKF